MSKSLVEEIIQKIEQAVALYSRLVIIAAPSGSGKTSALQEIANRTGAPLINVNLELSQRMLDLTERQRTLASPQILAEIINNEKGNLILLDNIEILFDVSLKLDSLRLLQGLSRNKTIVASWSGSIEENFLTYAIPGHPEYKKYPIKDLIIVTE
ncbi:BREX-3 system P-loop-containing protein BrxF [Candidatus Sumerlaeota bacterium]|nr:BREX-3 system P-loop-containing protein BrxF [Candidatus Sumerlaeota bacterium]